MPIIIFQKTKLFQMLYDKQATKIPKKTAQKISKFSYYVDTFFPDFFSTTQNTQNTPNQSEKSFNQLLTKTGNRNLTYKYFYSKCQNSSAINADSILSCVKKLYLNQDVIKINEMSYSRETVFKQSYLPVYGFFSEIIDFVLLIDGEDKNEQPNKQKNLQKSQMVQSRANLNSPRDQLLPGRQNIKSSKTLPKPKKYWLYVIHNCNSFKPESQQMKNICWEHFIQRYHFTQKNLADPKSVSTIQYQLAYCYKAGGSLLSFQQNLIKMFVESHCRLVMPENTLQNLQKLQGYLLQRSSQVQAGQLREKDVAFSDEHRRETKIPIEYFKQYVALKKEVYQFYVNLHGLESQDEIKKYFYQNLICRYLVAKQYNFDDARKGILQYLKWQKQLKDKYPSLECFKQYHSLGAYQYIGQDFMGRPVILSKASLIEVDKLPSIEGYCDYYIYYLEIYLRTKMRGYVDQMLVIGDLSNLSSNNFKLAITKRNLSDSLNYGPQRQHGLVIVNASSFAYTAWMFIKPLMPKKTLHKIEISGHDTKQILECLSGRMDISVIKEYLGGKNTKIDLEFANSDKNDNRSPKKEQEIEFVKSRKRTMSRIEKISKEEEMLEYDEVEMVSTESVVTEVKKNDGNLFMSLFSSISKSLGIGE